VLGGIGDGTTTTRLTPVLVPGISNAVAITASDRHTCALIADGTARCWGSNFFGEIGNNTTDHQFSPVPVLGLTNAVAIETGDVHTCAMLADGTARCWGLDSSGELGDGNVIERHTPVAVLGLTNAVALSAGASHTCATIADGSMRCWGRGLDRQLGNGSFSSVATPVVVLGGGGSITARDIAAGRNHTCVVRASGAAACWGSDISGQIGDGATGVNRLGPVAVPGLGSVVAIAGGEAHTCALLANGTVRCWGQNSSGEIGDGTNIIRSSPVPVAGLSSVVAVATGGDLGASHTCALIADGTVRCWGANNRGQLGDNTTASRFTPVVVQGLGNAVEIAVGAFHSCALLANGTAQCWGANDSGQLGDDTRTPQLAPVAVSGISNAVSIASGDSHNCALLVSGAARCWGENTLGQLGNSGAAIQPFPSPVANLTGAAAIAGGFGHSCAILVQALGARCWGTNSLGELGDGTTTSSKAPVVVAKSSMPTAVTITTGRHHTCALLNTGGSVVLGRQYIRTTGFDDQP